jgi:nucleoside-diphosphate-sugar epimerase
MESHRQGRQATAVTSQGSARPWIISQDEPVLVTGANGFIGAQTVKALLAHGLRDIRCFARPSGNLDRLKAIARSSPGGESAVRVVEGNLLTPDDCARAAAGVRVVFHLAAGLDKSFAGCFMNSVLTTRNLLEALIADGSVRRFVNVSSFAVYSNLHMKRGSMFDERTPLETAFNERADPYGYGKLKQEELVRRYHQQAGVQYVIVRPGAVWGAGKPSLTGRVGIDTFGVFLHMGGSNRVPFTYVDNCAAAIALAGLVDGVDGEVFNVVDDEAPTSREFLRFYKRTVRPFMSLPVPYTVSYLLSALWEDYSNRSLGQLPPRFNRRRASAEWKRHRYSNAKIKTMLGWSPQVGFAEAARRFGDALERDR